MGSEDGTTATRVALDLYIMFFFFFFFLRFQPNEKNFKTKSEKPSVVVHACNPSTQEAETGGFLEFKAT
jgi:hypothetical protein